MTVSAQHIVIDVKAIAFAHLFRTDWFWGVSPAYAGRADGFEYAMSDLPEESIVRQLLGPTLGVPAQGLVSNKASFSNHYIVHWKEVVDGQENSYYFDPSYGLVPCETLLEWQSIALAGTSRSDKAAQLGLDGGNTDVVRAKKIGSPLPGDTSYTETLDVKAIGDF